MVTFENDAKPGRKDGPQAHDSDDSDEESHALAAHSVMLLSIALLICWLSVKPAAFAIASDSLVKLPLDMRVEIARYARQLWRV